VKAKRRDIVSVIGDSTIAGDSVHFRYARETGRLLIENDYRLISGGMGGVMEAACKGAWESERHRDGDIIAIVPTYDPADANRYADVAIATGMGHLRNQIVANSDAVIAIGGGAGTLSEIAFAWMLGRLIIALKVEGWSGRFAGSRVDSRIRYPDIPEDCVFAAETPEQAVAILNQYLPKYSRFIRGFGKW